LNFEERKKQSLQKLERWRRANPGMSDGGSIALPGDEPEETETEVLEESVETPVAYSKPLDSLPTIVLPEQIQADRQFHFIDRIFKALAQAPAMKLTRKSIREKALNEELSAAELTELQNHPLIQQFVTFDRSQRHASGKGPFIELWILNPEALTDSQLGFVFGDRYKPERPKEPEPKEEEAPILFDDLSQKISISELVRMPYSEFLKLPEDQRQRCPKRNREERTVANSRDWDARFDLERSAWPEYFDADEGKWLRDFPRDERGLITYWGDPEQSRAEMMSRLELEAFLNGRSFGKTAIAFKTPLGKFVDQWGHEISLARIGTKWIDSYNRILTIIDVPSQPSKDHFIVTREGKPTWTNEPQRELTPEELDATILNIDLPPVDDGKPPVVLSEKADSWHRPKPPEPKPPVKRDSREAIINSMKAFSL
jgi:hypothetical protein